ncbi:hypothetical protein TRICHSKD4_6032 [Roseibium sp. TrichSKD4]|nr:hypothetical protein TRICHSKD4_6032 [Roseibium sp. TrichSKD4]
MLQALLCDGALFGAIVKSGVQGLFMQRLDFGLMALCR